MYDQVFLSDIADTNPEVLGASTESDRELIYLDLGCVQSGCVNWQETQSLLFRQAPSRARRKVLAGDILFGTVRPSLQSHGHIGEAATGNLVASTGFTVIRAIKGLSHDRYLFHAILSNEVLKQSVNVSVGSNYPAVTERDVRHFRIRFPGLPEQQKIAQILDTLDTQIQETEALIAKLEKIKEGLVHDLLTRGIDQSGQLRPTPEQAPELYKDSALGLVPKSWDICSLGSIAEIVSGVTLGGQQPSRSWPLVAYLRVANVQDGYLDLEQIKFLRVKPADVEKFRLLPGDVLMNEGGDFDKLGRGTVWEDEIRPCIHQNHVFRVRAYPEALVFRLVNS